MINRPKPIENFFHLIEHKNLRDTIDRKITSESYVKILTRVRTTMMIGLIKYPSDRIHKIIDTMNKKINTSKNKGKRLKY